MKEHVHAVTVTPIDQFNAWRREGERCLQELTSYRVQAIDRRDKAIAELDDVDTALAALRQLLGVEQVEGT